MSEAKLSSQHCRAICNEVGERLRYYLDRSSTSVPSRLLELLQQLALREVEAPSIVPDMPEERVEAARLIAAE